ncbi:NAD(P)H-binding protein [Halobacillus massiliensis]|uniref:NAD(P)H-binding protein n=1 Tax=Halobacillus massiliensis TaxID=1926286 RepID=UPI001FE2B550|nr:NAD(P)H-binding protein [Halobacillus massiliensis]
MNKNRKRPVIALTGASGYIGSNLLEKITVNAEVIALSRNGDEKEDSPHVKWRSCDLYSLADAEKGLKGADIAVYLVHSMMPSAKLTQGTFEDMDVILADNFAQAARKNGVKQIIYLSGIIPKNGKLSRHLRSRLEVEEVLRSYGVPVTTIRAGLIVGPKGSSFPILAKLVRRLPVMALPKWTRIKTHPIALPDVLEALNKSIGNDKLSGRSLDVGGPEVMTYKDMMLQTAEAMGKKPKLFDVPFITIKLSRLWVSLTTQTPREQVYPLIESLIHPMTAEKENMDAEVSYGRTMFKDAAEWSLAEEKEKQESSAKKLKAPKVKQDVRSVQRIELPQGKSAQWAAQHYVEWLADKFSPVIKTNSDNKNNYKIRLAVPPLPLLKLSYSKQRSTTRRSLYYITGGLFFNSKKNTRGRLEFRQIPNTNQCIVAVHDYLPSLPWFIYKYTQAKVHLMVMYLYRKHLQEMSSTPKKRDIREKRLQTS